MKTTGIMAVAVPIVASGLAVYVTQAQQVGARRIDLQRHDLSVTGRELVTPHFLKVRHEQLWATFETSFKGRTEAAMIGLYRAARRVAEAAEAADER